MTKTNCKKIASGVAGLMTAVFLACPALAGPVPVTQIANTTPGVTNIASDGSATAVTTGVIARTETITQTTRNAIIDWNSFNIGVFDTVNFNQTAGNNSIALNRIHQGSASQIYGRLTANGNIILANGSGIYFGPTSYVNVGGLIATASSYDSANSTFTPNGVFRPKFEPGSNHSAAIINFGGHIETNGNPGTSGLLAFVAPNVGNLGLIEATAGQVHMASGDSFTVDFYGDGLLNLAASDDVTGQIIANAGKISANGGQVFLTAAAAKNVVDSLINMSGLIEADSIGYKHGKVVLTADIVEVEKLGHSSATISAKGGTISITGTNGDANHAGVTLDNATLDAGDGSIFIWGHGFGTPRTPDDGNNYGVYIKNGTEIKTTGSRSIISITGFGGNGMGIERSADNNHGVYITGSKTEISSVGGDIMIAGFGGGVDAAHGSGKDHGVFISGGAEVKTHRGDIYITGFGGGCDTYCGGNVGVYIKDRTTLVYSETGDTFIFGKGGAIGEGYNGLSKDNYGVFITDYAGVGSHTGDITITGIGGANDYYALKGNYGIVMTNGGWVGGTTFNGGGEGGGVVKSMMVSEGGSHDHGDITFVTDTILFDSSARVRTYGDVDFQPFSNRTTIGIAGGPGTLQLTKTVLDDVYADTITIGNTYRDYGKITAYAYDWRMPVSILNGGLPFATLSNFGDIEIDGIQTINGENTFWGRENNTFRAVTALGDIIIGKGGAIISGGESYDGPELYKTVMVGGDYSEGEGGNRNTLITLAASFGRFLNFGGPDAIQPGNGRWLVYSFSPVDDVFGGLNSYNEAIWGRVYNKHSPIYQSGDRYIFTVCPTLTVTFNDMTKFFGTDNASDVAVDSYSLDYTVRGLLNPFVEHDLLAYVGDVFHLDTVEVAPRTSAGSPASAPVGAYPDIWGKVTHGAKGMHVKYNEGTLTVLNLSLNNVLDRSKAPGRRGPNGTLLSIVNAPGGLANLAPAAGGNLADLSPKAGGDMGDLANLNPQAGGASITPLIQCNEVTPCDINQ